MTATEVEGRRVIATEIIHSPLSKPESPKTFKQVVKLLLEDGTEMVGCAYDGCTYANDKIGVVRAHSTSVHSTRGERRKPGPKPRPVLQLKARSNSAHTLGQLAYDLKGLTLEDLLNLADQAIDAGSKQEEYDNRALEKALRDVALWKLRARQAKAKLKNFANLIQSMGAVPALGAQGDEA